MTQPTASHVFISYSRRDEVVTRRIVDFLRGQGFRVWVDNENLVPGTAVWEAEIEKAIIGASAVVVVLSPDSKESEWVRREISYADEYKKRVFPILVRGSENTSMSLRLITRQYADIRKNEPAGLQALCAALSEYLNRPYTPPPGGRSGGAWKKWWLTGLIALGVLGIGWGANYLLLASQGSNTPPTENTQASEIGLTDEPMKETEPIIPTSAKSYPNSIFDSKDIPMVLIPAGDFTMGSSMEDALSECRKLRSDAEKVCIINNFINETPVHNVVLDEFYIDKFEVSNQQYKACVDDGVCQPPTERNSYSKRAFYGVADFNNYPVTWVDWPMAETYCKWRDASLPTEAQWEKAARGVSAQVYPWGNIFNDALANTCDINCEENHANHSINDGYAYVSPIDAFPDGASIYGVFNLSGNVWEWVADWYDEKYYSKIENGVINPTGPVNGEWRVKRGSSWYGYEINLRSATRDKESPTSAKFDLGFRCAAPVP